MAGVGLANGLRFGSPFSTGYAFDSGEGFSTPFWLGFGGLLVSGFRGLLWYSPAVLLAAAGGWALRRREPRLTLAAAGLGLAALLPFSLWSSWEGGLVWGPRFLLPALPALMLLAAGMVESRGSRVEGQTRPAPSADALFDGFDKSKPYPSPSTQHLLPEGSPSGMDAPTPHPTRTPRWASLLGTLLLVTGFAVQLLGALYDPRAGGGAVLARITDPATRTLRPEAIWGPEASAILQHAAFLAEGRAPDWPWLAGGFDPAIPAAAAALLLVTLWAWRRGGRTAGAGLALAAGLTLAVTAWRADALTNAPRAALEAVLQPPGTLAVASNAFGTALLDLEPPYRVVGLHAPTTPDDRLARALWAGALDAGPRLWFVTWFGPADAANWMERELWGQYAFGGERAVEGHRALLFSLRPAPEPTRPAGQQFGPLLLAGYGAARAPDGLLVTLAWEAAAAPDEPLSWFAHLLAPDGSIVAQQDRSPLGGYAPVTGWSAGEIVIDRLFFPAAPAEAVQLRIGWLEGAGERLPALDASGLPLPGDFALLSLP